MPELPEVETVRKGLAPWLEGAKISDISVSQRQLRYPLPDNFESALIGSRIHKIHRRAKYLIFDMMGRGFLVHLGMSGSMRTVSKSEALQKHDHIVITTDKARVVFHDPRRFGAMDLWDDQFETHKWLKNLGPEPLGNNFSSDYLRTVCNAQSQSIKQILLDQNLIAGIGNIYASEALWRARIDPRRTAQTLKKDEIDQLVVAIRDVLNAAIISGGSSLKDHRKVNGELGYFQHQFDVYDRKGESCHRPKCEGLIHKITQSSRSSFLCELCQD